MLNPRHLDSIPSISYQLKNKKNAVVHYKRAAMFDHENFIYKQCGLIINPRLPYFVGSPDGIVSCSCHGTGCVVLKCLKILESGGSYEVLTAKPNNMLNQIGDNIYELEKSHELFHQIQLQINLISLSYCDVVFWSPRNILIIRVDPDIVFWQTEMKKALAFHEQVMMPEILAKYFTKFIGSETQKEGQLVKLEVEVLCHDVELGFGIADLCSDKTQTTEEPEPCDECDEVCESSMMPPHQSRIEESVSQEVKSINVEFDSEFKLRNLKHLSTEDILRTYFDHEEELKLLYGQHIKELKSKYCSKDIPELIALDIVNEKQLGAMAVFAETKLVCNLKEETDSTHVIFDSVLPEWTLAAFCKHFKLTRVEAVDTIKLQSEYLIETYDSDD